MIREEYERLKKVANEEFEGSPYRLMDYDDDPNTPRPYPYIVDLNTRLVPDAFRATKDEKYLKLGIDLLIWENAPEDERTMRAFHRNTWLLSKVFYVMVTPYTVPPLKNRGLKLLATLCLRLAHYLLRLVPPLRRSIRRHWTTFCRRYYGKTDNFVFPLTQWLRYLCHTRAELLPDRRVAFEDTDMPLAAGNDQILRGVFGDYMIEPPPEERGGHPSSILELY
jgi:lipopolysaccharide cholinephosphotransferase